MLFLGLLVRQREEFVVFQSKKATPSPMKSATCCVIIMEGLSRFWANCDLLLGNLCRWNKESCLSVCFSVYESLAAVTPLKTCWAMTWCPPRPHLQTSLQIPCQEWLQGKSHFKIRAQQWQTPLPAWADVHSFSEYISAQFS